jgi:hypothetical protein
MTAKDEFTEQEWKQVLQGPPTAGMIVAMAQRGGSFRETISMAKAYAEARKEHGESELLDEIASTKPEVDRTRYRSPDELREHGLERLRETVALVERKASAEEVDDYRRFVLNLARRVAEAHREDGERVSEAEHEAIAEVAEALGSQPPQAGAG